MVTGLDKAFRFYEEALNVRSYRQQLLASNIANADTPNYKAVDVDFKAALQGALEGGQQLALTTTSPRHLEPKSANPLGAQVLYRVPLQPSIDGNTVDTQVEMAQFSDNAIHYQTDLTVLSGRIKSILAALQG